MSKKEGYSRKGLFGEIKSKSALREMGFFLLLVHFLR